MWLKCNIYSLYILAHVQSIIMHSFLKLYIDLTSYLPRAMTVWILKCDGGKTLATTTI